MSIIPTVTGQTQRPVDIPVSDSGTQQYTPSTPNVNDAGDTRGEDSTTSRDNDRLPEFPTEGYLGICAGFAELYSRHSESPKAFYFIDCLTLLGNVFSGTLTFKQQQPRLYVLKVQESAFGRKSTSMKAAKKVVKA